jgi:hypothetical protein
MASGKPSTRAQMAATSLALAAVSSMSGRVDLARAMKRWTAGERAISSAVASPPRSGRARGVTGTSCSPERRRGGAAGHDQAEALAACQQRPEGRGGVEDVLEVVEHEQEVLVRDLAREGGEERVGQRTARAEGLGDGGQHQVGIVERGEVDPAAAVREAAGCCGGDADGEGGSCRRRRVR